MVLWPFLLSTFNALWDHISWLFIYLLQSLLNLSHMSSHDFSLNCVSTKFHNNPTLEGRSGAKNINRKPSSLFNLEKGLIQGLKSISHSVSWAAFLLPSYSLSIEICLQLLLLVLCNIRQALFQNEGHWLTVTETEEKGCSGAHLEWKASRTLSEFNNCSLEANSLSSYANTTHSQGANLCKLTAQFTVRHVCDNSLIIIPTDHNNRFC